MTQMPFMIAERTGDGKKITKNIKQGYKQHKLASFRRLAENVKEYA